MGDSFHQQQQQTTRQSNSRLGLRQTGGEIVEVQGGHIVRSTGRKDRHSKVCTAKGPRDRRVRLSAHTAIEFYDVQDRLGYDRPSKAVDWLIKKAKAAIDELEELPAWTPTAAGTTLANNNNQQESGNNQQNPIQQISVNHHGDLLGSISGGCSSSSKRAMTNMQHNSGNSSTFLPPSLDSDSIADTIKSFFPMGASNEANSSGMQFQSQDLRLSLQSFQDPIMLHHHHSQQQQQQQSQHHHNALFSGATQLGFDASGWSSDHHQQQQSAEIGRFQRLASWNAGGDGSTSGGASAAGGGGYLFNSQPAPPPPQPLLQQLFGPNQLFSQQRGPLQSSNTPSIRAWMDPSSAITIATADHHHNHIQNQHHHHAAVLPIYPSGIGFASGIGGFPGFHIPARIQGEEEEHDGLSDKPSSASSDSRH